MDIAFFGRVVSVERAIVGFITTTGGCKDLGCDWAFLVTPLAMDDFATSLHIKFSAG